MSPEINGHRIGHSWSSDSQATVPSHGTTTTSTASSTTVQSVSPRKYSKLQSVIYLDMFGVSYFITYTVLIFVTSIILTMPVVYEESTDTLTLRRWFGMFLTFNTVANYILTVRNRSFYQTSSAADRFQGLPDSNWKRCIDCQHSSPPRTHHCPICDHCILKRDHHCFFTAACVSFHNQRWFILLCLYSTMGGIYGFYLTWQYITMEYMYIFSSNFYHFIFPVTLLECMLGYTSWMFLYLTILMYMSLFTLLGSGGIFLMQFYMACVGINSYELSKGIHTYRSFRILNNLNSVFGPFWMLQFIVPLPFLKSKGDGMHWPQGSKYI